MSGSVNKVILVGNLGRDPEVRSMSSGDPVVNLSLATSERWTDRSSGERREKTEWHRVAGPELPRMKLELDYCLRASDGDRNT